MRESIIPAERLALVLRFLATGMYLFNTTQTKLYNALIFNYIFNSL